MKTLLLVAVAALSASAMRDQSIAVKGILKCGDKPAGNVRIKLWEEDSGPDPDDLLDQGYTNSDGSFQLGGGTSELTPIDPIFKVYHDCDDGIKPGHRKVKFLLPKSYITSGKVPKKVFDIGVLNLETIFPKEERELMISRRRRDLARVRRIFEDEDELIENEELYRFVNKMTREMPAARPDDSFKIVNDDYEYDMNDDDLQLLTNFD